jgi:hypothetical protein
MIGAVSRLFLSPPRINPVDAVVDVLARTRPVCVTAPIDDLQVAAYAQTALSTDAYAYVTFLRTRISSRDTNNTDATSVFVDVYGVSGAKTTGIYRVGTREFMATSLCLELTFASWQYAMLYFTECANNPVENGFLTTAELFLAHARLALPVSAKQTAAFTRYSTPSMASVSASKSMYSVSVAFEHYRNMTKAISENRAIDTIQELSREYLDRASDAIGDFPPYPNWLSALTVLNRHATNWRNLTRLCGFYVSNPDTHQRTRALSLAIMNCMEGYFDYDVAVSLNGRFLADATSPWQMQRIPDIIRSLVSPLPNPDETP